MADLKAKQVQIVPVTWCDPRAVALREFMDIEMSALYGSRFSSLELDEVVAARRDFEFVATVLGKGGLVAAGIEWPLLAIGDDVQAGPVHALILEITLGCGGTPVGQSQIVFVGTALVGMAADAEFDVRVGVENDGLPIQGCLIGRAFPGMATDLVFVCRKR